MLGERLRALELGRGPAGSEHGDAALAQGVRDARDEGRLRPDHDEVDRVFLRELGHRDRIDRIERDELRLARDPRVAGGREDLVGGLLSDRSARMMACSRAPEPRTRILTRTA